MPATVNPKLLSWAVDIDDKIIAQATNTSNLPIIHGHMALMPDAHFGYGAPVGSVVATENAVIPSAVGVDIGCGMIAARLERPVGDVDRIDITSAEVPTTSAR